MIATNSWAIFSPRKVMAFSPSMKTGALGASPVPGSEMPIFAWRDSPGPLTTQPITASVRFSAPGWLIFHSGIFARTCSCTRWASSWKNSEVVRPQPGQAVTIGVNARRPIVCSSSCATTTSWVRGAPGSGVSEMRMVSPIPSCSSTASAALDAPRTQEVVVAHELLQTMGLRAFTPMVTACPGCGRTTSEFFQELAQRVQEHVRAKMPEWKISHPGAENLTLAVMGCVVNGPGESRHANIGISLPGTGEAPAAPVFVDGEKTVTLRGDNIASDFVAIIDAYVERQFGHARQTGHAADAG